MCSWTGCVMRAAVVTSHVPGSVVRAHNKAPGGCEEETESGHVNTELVRVNGLVGEGFLWALAFQGPSTDLEAPVDLNIVPSPHPHPHVSPRPTPGSRGLGEQCLPLTISPGAAAL